MYGWKLFMDEKSKIRGLNEENVHKQEKRVKEGEIWKEHTFMDGK